MKKLSIPMVVAAMDMVYGDEAKEDAYLLWVKEFLIIMISRKNTWNIAEEVQIKAKM